MNKLSMRSNKNPLAPTKQGLYDPQNEHDNCGIGFVANIKGTPSHDIVKKGLEVLKNLTHRGAVGCDPCTGDGAGIILQVPHRLLKRSLGEVGIKLPTPGAYGVGMVFLPQNPQDRIFEKIILEEDQRLLGWRDVPTKETHIGVQARESMPTIRQVFIARDILSEDEFEHKLYVMRRRIENAVRDSAIEDKSFFYVCSLSCNTILYKGLFLPDQLPL